MPTCKTSNKNKSFSTRYLLGSLGDGLNHTSLGGRLNHNTVIILFYLIFNITIF